MAIAGVSTLGIKFGYAMETTAGVAPSAFTVLNRINEIGGISLDTEQIDASALEDYVTRYIAGRQDTGGDFPITVNVTDETIAEWEAVINAYHNRADNSLSMWFEVWSPYLTRAFFIVAQPPKMLPMSDMAQNELQTMEISQRNGYSCRACIRLTKGLSLLWQPLI